MDVYRFYVPDLTPQTLRSDQRQVELPPDQAHHARNVLRLAPGAKVALFDGAGAWASAEIVQIGKHGALVEILGTLTVDAPPAPALTLATAVPKGDRADWLVEQASQLNVSAVQWLACDRAVVKPREGGNKMDKWRRLAIESAKQCGRNHLLEIRDPADFAGVLLGAPPEGTRVLWLDPGPEGVGVAEALRDWRGTVIALIGPEGGWSPSERTLLETAATTGRLHRIRLTETVLRIETACAAVAAIVMGR